MTLKKEKKMNQKKSDAFEEILKRKTMELLEELSEENNEQMIVAILMTGLSAVLKSSCNQQLSEHCLQYLQQTFDDIFSQLMSPGNVSEQSVAFH
jgi:hypothetical protein